MATLTAEERANRARKEHGRWEALRERGEGIQRENRRVAAQKAKEDGVDQRPKESRKDTMKM